MKSSPLPRYLVPLGSKFHLHYSIVEYPVFPLPYESPSLTPIQNNMNVYFSLCVFGCHTGRQKILHLVIESIPCVQWALKSLRMTF